MSLALLITIFNNLPQAGDCCHVQKLQQVGDKKLAKD